MKRALAGIATLALIASSVVPTAEPARAARAGITAKDLTYQWIAIDPRHPHTVYLGAVASGPGPGCSDTPSGCVAVPLYSFDAGNSWINLQGTFDLDASGEHCFSTLDPFQSSPDGQYLYTSLSSGCGSPGSLSVALAGSRDHGLAWSGIGDGGGSYGGGEFAPAISPADPRRLYAISYAGEGGPSTLIRSDDRGAHWRSEADIPYAIPAYPSASFFPASVVADTARRDTVYLNLSDDGDRRGAVLRSEDGGATLTPVAPPSASMATFAVSTDPHLPGLLVGVSQDKGIPADRRYLSGDGGRTWSAAACPGDHNGACPDHVVDNVFGAGASYALIDNGIYAFHGGGPAGTRLPISAALPFKTGGVIGVASGSRPGDPVYLLAADVLERSLDAGRSWQALPVTNLHGVLPNRAGASSAPGALYVPTTRHSVAPPFVAAYKRLGPRIAGLPVTEAYLDGNTRTQIFEHVALESHGTAVTVANLGAEVLADRVAQGDAALAPYAKGGGTVAPVSNMPTRTYFPKTGHTLSGDLLRFWQRHGGLAVFGAPITEVVRDTNGDGSGRSYEMQYFQKARLERHPELHDPRYAVLLGLLGDEAIAARGWT